MSDITVTNNAGAHRLEVKLGDDVAFADYRVTHAGLSFPHVEVPKAFEGKGVGSALVKAGLKFAQEQGMLVIPACPFFKSYLGKHREYDELVHPRWRHRA